MQIYCLIKQYLSMPWIFCDQTQYINYWNHFAIMPKQKLLGTLKFDIVLIVIIVSMISSTFFSYYMAVHYHEEKPFPHATVTNTACHYPQSIVFRYAMLIASSVLTLQIFLIFRWLEQTSIKCGYGKCPPKYQYYLGQFSMLCYSIVIGTIDVEGIGSWHTPCAIIFFILWVTGMINLTVFITKLRNWDTSIMPLKSLRLKQIIAGYVSLIWIYCLYKIEMEPSANSSFMYVVIVEWNSVIGNQLWLLSFIYEWKYLRLGLRKN